MERCSGRVGKIVRQARRDESRRGRHKRESALLAVSSVTNQHPKWAGEIAVNCFQIRSLARSSQRVVSGKCLRHTNPSRLTLMGQPSRSATSESKEFEALLPPSRQELLNEANQEKSQTILLTLSKTRLESSKGFNSQKGVKHVQMGISLFRSASLRLREFCGRADHIHRSPGNRKRCQRRGGAWRRGDTAARWHRRK